MYEWVCECACMCERNRKTFIFEIKSLKLRNFRQKCFFIVIVLMSLIFRAFRQRRREEASKRIKERESLRESV